MAKKKESIKEIPKGNYVIAIVIILLAIIITFYAFKWYEIAQREKIAESYLMSTNTIIHEIKNLNELDAVLIEAPEDYFIYISYTNSKEVYKLEEKLKPIIKAYNLKEEFYFLNITDIMDKDNYLDDVNKALDLPINIEKVPTILYFIDGSLVVDGVVARLDEKIIEAGDFQHLLDIFEIDKAE